jgi:hypothetical protein
MRIIVGGVGFDAGRIIVAMRHLKGRGIALVGLLVSVRRMGRIILAIMMGILVGVIVSLMGIVRRGRVVWRFRGIIIVGIEREILSFMIYCDYGVGILGFQPHDRIYLLTPMLLYDILTI